MKKLVLLITLPVLIVSCNKESTPPENNVACILTKRIFHDSKGNVSTTTFFYYDKNNRLDAISPGLC